MKIRALCCLALMLCLPACLSNSDGNAVQTSKAGAALLGNGTAIGVTRNSGGTLEWLLRSTASAGNADVADILYGTSTDTPVTGDWDGNSSTTIGVFRIQAGIGWWFLRNSNNAGNADLNPQFGQAGDVPIVGDWDGNRTTTIGVSRPNSSTGTLDWYLRNSNTTGSADVPVFSYGTPSLHDIPVAGDWDGDGTTTIGVARPESSTGKLHWFLRNQNNGGNADYDFYFGTNTDVPVVGDWDGNGTTTAGYFRPSTNQWFLTNSKTAVTTDVTFTYSASGSGNTPVAGAWPVTNVSPLANATSWTTDNFAGSVRTFVADVDGDGRGDVVALNSNGIVVRRSSGGPPLGSSETWSSTAFSGSVATLFADVTGDGKADAVAVNSGNVVVRPSTGTGFGTSRTWYTGSVLAGTVANVMGDVDGDGKQDLVAFQTDGSASVGLSSGSGFSARSWGTAGTVPQTAALFVADVTGDRRADMIAVTGSGVSVFRGQAPSVGLGSPEIWSSTAFYGTVGTFVTDVTGDGLADLVSVNSNGITMRRSGRWFFGENVETLSALPPTQSVTPLMGDLTGDKRADYVEVSATQPVTVRVRQDRQIPLRFVQLIAPGTACSSITQDADIQAAIADANVKYRDAGVAFFARPSKPSTQCSGLGLSTVVAASTLSNLSAASASTTELATIRDALNPACDMGASDYAALDGTTQLWWLSARCALAGEIVLFVVSSDPSNGDFSADASAGKMVVLLQRVDTQMAHELGHYFSLPHNFGVGQGFGMDPLTGQDSATSAFWDLAFVPSQPPAPALFFNSRSAAAAYESQLTRIQIGTDLAGPPPYESVNGWTCPNTAGSPCPSPALPFGSVAMPLAGDTSQLAYTFIPSTNPPQLDSRLKGTCPHPGDDRIDPSTGLPVPGVNVMSYAYAGGEFASGENGWLSLSQIEVIQNALTHDVAVSKLDATGHVIWGDRARLGIVAPPATLTPVHTWGAVMPGPGTLASNGTTTWVVGTNSYSADGNQVYSWNAHKQVWEGVSAGAKQLALAAGSSTAWAVTGTGSRVKRWNGSSFAVLPADSAGTCVRSLAVGAYASTTYAWSRSCQNADSSGNYPIIRYDDTNGWVAVAGPEPAAGVNGAFDLTVDSKGVVWALANRQGQTKAYKANLGSNGLPASWTSYATPTGTVHITGGADVHSDQLPVDVVDSSQGVSIFNNETGGWSPAMTLPFTVRQVSGSLPYLWVVNDADGNIWYVR